MDAESAQKPVRVTREFVITEKLEPGVVISVRDLERIQERLDGYRSGGWADLWLTGVGAGAALAVGALVGALTLPPNLLGTRDVLWGLVATGITILALCLFAYLTQRRGRGAEIGELKKDLDLYKP